MLGILIKSKLFCQTPGKQTKLRFIEQQVIKNCPPLEFIFPLSKSNRLYMVIHCSLTFKSQKIQQLLVKKNDRLNHYLFGFSNSVLGEY